MQIENCVNRTLSVIFDITKTIVYMKGIDSLVPDSKFVHLHKQTNYFPLLPSEYVSNYIDLGDEANTQFCSQRSQIWYRLRSKARITGSSMFRALGFDTLKEEKEHCYVYCKRRPPKDFTPQVQRYIQFSCENEIHAISMLVGLAMPALLAPCYVFQECGPMFILGQNQRNLIDVSGDGMLQCKNGENCNQKHPKDQRIAVEAKCLHPSEDFPKFPLYRMPTHHVPQIL